MSARSLLSLLRPASPAGAWLFGAVVAGCAVPGQMLASPDDLTDYRAFCLGSPEGPRLAKAQAYLERHPRGRWAEEVRRRFDEEEEAWFEAAKGSRSRARDYVVDLPNGPHVEAARALLVLFDQRVADLDELELMRNWQRTQVRLDLEASRRRRVGEVVLDELGALLDPRTPGADLDDPPPVLASVLRGPVRRSWGNGASGWRHEQLFFSLPTPDGAEARVVDVDWQLVLARGKVRGGRIEGEDLFVRWTEADSLHALDPGSPVDRATAADAVLDLVAGAIEARMPAARCTVPAEPPVLLTRACDGWHALVRMGAAAGDHDLIVIATPADAAGHLASAAARP